MMASKDGQLPKQPKIQYPSWFDSVDYDEAVYETPDAGSAAEIIRVKPIEGQTPNEYRHASNSQHNDLHHPAEPRSGSVSYASRNEPNGTVQFELPRICDKLHQLPEVYPSPNIHEGSYRHQNLKEVRSRGLGDLASHAPIQNSELASEERSGRHPCEIPQAITTLYAISYLILFSFLGTLARLGLQAITLYPGAPVIFSELWANFGGSVFMGFLSEDRMLFKEGWGLPMDHQQLPEAQAPALTREASMNVKKTIPLYIGLATGFCGSFTSFSSFIRDAFLAMSNDLPSPPNRSYDSNNFTAPNVSRNGGYSVMALLAVVITTIALCISGLYLGAHLTLLLEQLTPSLSFKFCRRLIDPTAVFLAWGCWIGAIFLAIFPPDRYGGAPEVWRGRVVFALVFSPVGCLGRFYTSMYLNGIIASFPLSTFVVNMFGTAILGMTYDLQHADLGGVVGCQVLQGIEDGFCGCLTTVSTWVSELTTLRRRHAYGYGGASVVVALCLLILITGSFRWSEGFSGLKCTQ